MTMPSRAMSLRPVHSEKKETSWSNLGQNASTTISINLAFGKQAADVDAATDVITGSTVRWIYFEFHFAASTITSPKVIHWQIVKRPFNTTISIPSTYNSADKRFVIRRGMEMLPKDVATVFKRVFVVKIPPRMRRIGDQDVIQFQYIASSAESINACGIAIYKVLT